jgi:hypothetical protein
MDSIEKAERGHVDIVAGEGFVDWLMRNSLRGFMASHPKVNDRPRRREQRRDRQAHR